MYNALLSMSNRTQSICTMLYYQCQKGHNLSVQCCTIYVKQDTIFLYNAVLSMLNRTQSICTILHYLCKTGHNLSAQFPIYVYLSRRWFRTLLVYKTRNNYTYLVIIQESIPTECILGSIFLSNKITSFTMLYTSVVKLIKIQVWRGTDVARLG